MHVTVRCSRKALAVAALGLAAAGTRAARGDVYWSVGVDAAPGVSVGVGNHAPVLRAARSRCTWRRRPCVCAAPALVYVQPPVVYSRRLATRPVVVHRPATTRTGPSPWPPRPATATDMVMASTGRITATGD